MRHYTLSRDTLNDYLLNAKLTALAEVRAYAENQLENSKDISPQEIMKLCDVLSKKFTELHTPLVEADETPPAPEV